MRCECFSSGVNKPQFIIIITVIIVIIIIIIILFVHKKQVHRNTSIKQVNRTTRH